MYVLKPSNMPHVELISRRQCGFMEKDLNCGTWNMECPNIVYNHSSYIFALPAKTVDSA
jgi:hypothetical protein